MKRFRTLSYLIVSQLFSVIGTVIIQFTLSLYILDLTGSPLAFSVITSLAVIGRLVMLPFCGIIADRINKKKVMIMMDGSYFAVTLLMLLALQLEEKVVVLGILTCFMGMVSAFETPVVQSSIPLICDEEMMPTANSIVSSIGILGNMFGPILAGVIYRSDAVQQTFFLCLLLFILAVLVECLMKIQELPVANHYQRLFQVVKADLMDVRSYLMDKTIILKICLMAFFLNFLLSSFIQVVIPYIARVWFAVSNQQFGVMNFLFAAGGLLGSIIYGVFSRRMKLKEVPFQLIMTGILFLMIVIPLSGEMDQGSAFWWMTTIVTLVMALVTMVSIQLVVFIQAAAPTRLLGRLMSFVMIVSTLATPLGQVLFGWISGLLGLQEMSYVVYGVSLTTILVGRYSRTIFRVEENTTGEQVVSEE